MQGDLFRRKPAVCRYLFGNVGAPTSPAFVAGLNLKPVYRITNPKRQIRAPALLEQIRQHDKFFDTVKDSLEKLLGHDL